ncbi:putative alpha crystallin/Hsp20 domain, HSP20-like chaperone [Arabidopsis thaliana]
MELELGLKITRTREDISSSVDFRFSKDPFGPLVLSRETDSRFIIIIHLKGFKKEGIEIDINEEGNRITIRGRKPVEEMVMIRWMAWRKEVEFSVFKKVFRIPDTVDLDKIKARFDDDDATLTITMPKRVKGISGFKIEEEEEEEEEEERVDVSEAEHKEETEKGELKDDYLEKSHQIDERIEEEKGLADSNKESVDSSLRKPPDIEGRECHEQTRHEEQENNKQLVQAESDDSDDFGSRAFEEIEEQESDVLDRTSTSGAMEKEMTDDVGDGLRKVQGIEEPERHNEESKISEMVDGETSGHEKKKVVKMDKKNRDVKEEVDGAMGEGFRPNIDRTQVVGDDEIAETEKNDEEFESDKLEADEVDKINEGGNTKVRRHSEDRNLIKLQEKEEQHSKEQKGHSKEENMKELVEEKTPEAETTIRNDILGPGQEIEVPEVDTLGKTSDEGKEKQNIVKKEIKNGDATEEIDAKMGEVFASNIADTGMNSEDFESDKLESADEVDKMVEKKDRQEENDKVGAQSEDISLTKLQEIGEQQFQGQKRHDKQENIKELREGQASEAEKNIKNDILKPVQKRSEGKHKIQKTFQEETNKQPEGYNEKIMETGKKINEDGTRKVQEMIRQQELDEPARSEKENRSRELVKSKTNDEEKKEKEIAGTERKEKESDRPKILREQEVADEVAEDKTKFSIYGEVKEEEEIAGKEKEFGSDDDIARIVRDTEQLDSNAMKGQEEKDMIQELVLEEKVCDGGKGIIAVAETKAENNKSKRVQETEEQKLDKEDTCGKHFQKLIEGEISDHGEVEDVEKGKKRTEAEKRIKDRAREAEEIKEKDLGVSGRYIKGTTIKELVENRGIYRNEHEEKKKDDANRPEKITGTIKQELVSLNSQLRQENVEDGDKTQELVEEKIKDCEEEEGSEESKIKTDDVVRKVQELVEETTGDYEKQEEKETAESDIEAECGSLRKVDGIEEHELHEPKIHKERDNNRVTGAKEPSGQEKGEKEEKIVESMTITENDNSIDVQETKKERPGRLESHDKRYKIQELLMEAGHNDRKEEEQNENVTAEVELETERVSSKKVQEGKMEDDNSGKFHEFEERKSYEDWTHEKREKRKVLVEEEETYPKDKHTGGEDHNDHKEEEQKENVIAKAELNTEEDSFKKVEEIEKQDHGELKRSMVQAKRQETEEKDKTRAMEKNETVERRKQTKDGSLGKLREGEDPELGGHERRGEEDRIEELVETEISDHKEKVKKKDEDYILRSQDTGKVDLGERERRSKQRKIHKSVEDEIGDQEDEDAEEAAAVVSRNENGSSRKVQTIEEESEKHKEQNKIPETSNPEVNEEDEERVVEKETKEVEAHVQELEGKTENCKDDDGEGRREERGKQGMTAENMLRQRFKTKSDDGIVRKIQETKEEEPDEKKSQESSSHVVKLVAEDGSLRNGLEFSEKESTVSKMLKLDESKEKEEHKKIRKPTEERSNAPVIEKQGNKKNAEEEMQDKIDRRGKNQEIKGQEPYGVLRNGEHDKITEYHRGEEKGTAENVSSTKIQQTKDELEKPRKPSEISENHNIHEFMDSSQSQDIEEKGSDQAEKYAKQNKIQEVMNDEDKKEEYHISERVRNEMAKRILQVESKANDGSSKKNETEGQESTGLRGRKKRENHQELVELETSDQKKGVKEDEVVGKAEIIEDEYDSSRKIHEHEERMSDKLEMHGEEEMSEKLAEEETSDGEEAKEGNRAGKKSRDDGFGKVRKIEVQRKDNDQSFVEKDTSGKAKENLNDEEPTKTETKATDNESRKIHQIKEQGTSEQERLKEQGRIKELVEDRTHFCREKENRETEYEDGSSKMIQEIDKEESIEPVDRETSEDDEEELEIEFEDEEEDWEAEVIQETDSDSDNDKIRQIKRIRLGFRLVGGSTLFMSLIVIVISIIRSKRNIRCYKF